MAGSGWGSHIQPYQAGHCRRAQPKHLFAQAHKCSQQLRAKRDSADEVLGSFGRRSAEADGSGPVPAQGFRRSDPALACADDEAESAEGTLWLGDIEEPELFLQRLDAFDEDTWPGIDADPHFGTFLSKQIQWRHQVAESTPGVRKFLCLFWVSM